MRPTVRGVSARSRKAALFVALALLSSWSIAGVYFGLGGRWGGKGTTVIGALYMIAPGVVAIVLQRAVFKEPLRNLGFALRPSKWYLVAGLAPALIAAAAVALSLLVPGATLDPRASMLAQAQAQLAPEVYSEVARRLAGPIASELAGMFVQALIAGFTLNAVTLIAHELGWRGLLHRQIEDARFWNASLLTGALWGLWYLPLVWHGHNFPESPRVGALVMFAWCTLMSPVLTFIRARAASVGPTAILLGVLTALSGFPRLLVYGGTDLTIGIYGLPGLVVLLAANVWVYRATR